MGSKRIRMSDRRTVTFYPPPFRGGSNAKQQQIKEAYVICYYCEAPLDERTEIHHIQPTSWGGKDRAANRVTLHRPCHREYHVVLEGVRRQLGGVYSDPAFFTMFVEDILEHADNPRFERALRVVRLLKGVPSSVLA